jgi:hypothetical protein
VVDTDMRLLHAMWRYVALLTSVCVDLMSFHQQLVTATNEALWVDTIADNGVIDTDAIFGIHKADFTVCATTRCASEIIKLPQLTDKMVIFLVVNNIHSDSYFQYYLGMIYDTFKYNNMHILIVSVSHGLPKGPYDYKYVRDMIASCSNGGDQIDGIDFCDIALPQLKKDFRTLLSTLYHKKLAIVVLHDNILNINYVAYAQACKQRGRPLFMLIHLNHEQPWIETSESVKRIEAAYEATTLVFRTHYSADLMTAGGANVHYLPLGAGTLLTDLMIDGVHHNQRTYPKTIVEDASQSVQAREWLCSFAGSMKYKSRGGQQEHSRMEMVNLLQDIPGCVFHPTDDANQTPSLTREEYLRLAGATLFSLCPRGVGPETNRPHQALMMGAVPLMVREQESDKDFLTGKKIEVVIR